MDNPARARVGFRISSRGMQMTDEWLLIHQRHVAWTDERAVVDKLFAELAQGAPVLAEINEAIERMRFTWDAFEHAIAPLLKRPRS
jgi:hypothetical protein